MTDSIPCKDYKWVRILELEADNKRLRNALQQIAETETDWRIGVDANMNVVRGIAERVLYEAPNVEEVV